jgi:Na+/phosphate symporter
VDSVRFGGGAQVNSVVDFLFDPIAGLASATLPHWTLFPIGLGIIMTSFNLFDRCLPQMSLKESQVGQMARLVYRPWVMFALGAAITSISMSVSVSLGILVPLNQRGYIRRENVIPYIMGANITTFIDTLLATLLLENPAAFTVVLVEMLSVTIVSVIILATIYHWYERSTLNFVAWVTARNRNLAFFMISIFVVPILLMLR